MAWCFLNIGKDFLPSKTQANCGNSMPQDDGQNHNFKMIWQIHRRCTGMLCTNVDTLAWEVLSCRLRYYDKIQREKSVTHCMPPPFLYLPLRLYTKISRFYGPVLEFSYVVIMFSKGKQTNKQTTHSSGQITNWMLEKDASTAFNQPILGEHTPPPKKTYKRSKLPSLSGREWRFATWLHFLSILL